jgi:hypothetical protein
MRMGNGMAVENTNTTKLEEAERASWLPMIIILLAQIQMAFNVNALPVSIGAIVDDLDVRGRLRHAWL